MRLKKLEIYGFKSFAERIEMTFDQGITGIVGPNGSGKSNISDAVRWVLGEQSAKTLRGARMEDVIFSGTEKRRRMAWCEVILTFDNPCRELPIDFTEVAVSRRVYRNGEGEYMINGNACRLKDVVDLFRDTGIGKEGYSLIGQGRIDEILSVRSEDRRQIFEEAAGIVKYKARKLEAERRLENTRLNLSRVEDIIAELEARLAPLAEQSRVAREYLALQDELKGLELNAFLARSDRLNAQLSDLGASARALDEGLAQAREKREALVRRRGEAEEQLASLERSAACARDEVQALIRQVESREGVMGVLRARIEASERELAQLLARIEAARGEDARAERAIEDAMARTEAERASASSERAALSGMEADLERLAADLADRERRAEELKARVIEGINRLSDVRSEQSRLQAMQDALCARLKALGEEDASDGAKLAGREAARARAEERLCQERADKEALDAELTDVQGQVAEAGARAEQLEAERSQTAAKRQEVASRLRVLEEMQRDYEGYQHSVKQVLRQARRAPDSCVHGVVATLIAVPRELERAIDMVLGAALQHVVVEREEDAQRMIDFLKRERLGRATFLPLSAVRGRTLTSAERAVLSMPGCLGLASELVGFDARYQGVVDSLLGRTVVARDLDAGIAIQRAGRHAFRLVTLDGDVMHAGGSMSGGSAQSRVTSILSREREVSEHRARLQELEASLASAQARLRALEEARAGLKQRRSALFERQRQQEIACAREEASVKAADEALLGERERAARARGEAERLRAQLEDVAGELARLTDRHSGEERAGEDERQLVVAVSREIAALRERVAERRALATDGRVAQAARERGLDALEADMGRLRAQRANLREALRAGCEDRAACEVTLEGDRAQLLRDEAALTDEKRALFEKRAEFTRADEARTRAQRLLMTTAEEADALREEEGALSERLHRAQMQFSRLEGELKQLTDRIWEDYQLTYAGAEAFKEPEFKFGEAEKRIAAIRARIRELGTVNVSAVDEYRQTQARFSEMSAQRDDLVKAQIDLAGIIEELVRKMEAQFRAQFRLLNENFQDAFARLFGGGRAELRLEDERDVLHCGIDVVAQPPGKKLQMLSLLSGGERALTAIAILFAMLKLKPTPFCILDEIEAALDDANIDHFADFLLTYSQNTQFVVVTHRKGTMERCHALYGVAMEEKGVSRMVSVKLDEARQGAM